MSTSVLQVRVEDGLRAKASALYEELGIDLPTAVRIFLKRSVMENGLPFNMTLSNRRELVIERGLKAIERMQEESERNGNCDMTLDEINAEISAARAERRAKRAQKVAAS